MFYFLVDRSLQTKQKNSKIVLYHSLCLSIGKAVMSFF
jgi:hypothetical protein